MSIPQVSVRVEDPGSVDAAITSRFSARAFLPRPVPREMLEDILRVASRAPSGTNTQPWKVYVLQGASRDSLVRKVSDAFDAMSHDPAQADQYREEYAYYPSQWFSPYLDRRRQNGWSLYGLLGINKGEKDKMHAQHRRNFAFFDAPLGLMFTIDRRLERGSLLDYGMFIQNISVAARARGLHTCAQAAWNFFGPRIILPHLGAQDHEMVVCGMALGWADEAAPVNTLQTPREPVESFTQWLE